MVDNRTYDNNVLSRLRTFGDFNLTVSNGSKDSVGVIFVGNDMGGLPSLKLLGKTTITADRALVSEYWEHDGKPIPGQGSDGNIQLGDKDGKYASELTINGTVDDYTGYFVQYKGTKAALNTDTWFGGMAKFYGGTMSAPDAVYDTTVKSPLGAQPRLYIMGDEVDLTLKGMKIGDLGPTADGTGRVTVAKMYGGKLNLETLSIAEGGKFGVNAGTITVTGESSIAGRLRPTTPEDGDGASDIITAGQPHSSATLITKGVFTIENTGILEINNLTVDGGTFTNLGKINANVRTDGIEPIGHKISVTNGATFTNSGNVFTNTLTIDGEGTKFVSTNAINSKESEQAGSKREIGNRFEILNGAIYETSSSELFLTNVIGKDATWREMLTTQEIEKTSPFEMGRFTLQLDGGKFVYREQGKTEDHEFNNFLIQVDESDELNKPANEDQNPLLLVSNGTYDWEAVTAGHLGTLGIEGGSLSLKQLSIESDGVVKLKRGSLNAEKIETASGAIGKLDIQGGTLSTLTNQIFAAGLNEAGNNIDPQALRLGDSLIFTQGTIAFNDARYNVIYADAAGTLLGASTGKMIVFNGERVEAAGGTVDIDKLPDSESGSVVESNVTAAVTPATETDTSAVVDKSIGVSKIEVGGNSVTKVTIDADSKVTLVGSTDAEGEVIKFTGTNT